jgi:hypothetical protein
MLLWSVMLRCVEPIATIAACMSFKDPFVCPLHKQVREYVCAQQLHFSCVRAQQAADAARKRFALSSMSDHVAV